MPIRIIINDATMATLARPTKSKLVLGRISSISRPLSNAQPLDVAAFHEEIINYPGNEQGGEQRRGNPQREGYSKALDRAGAELEQNQGGQQGGQVRVHDRPEGLLV